MIKRQTYLSQPNIQSLPNLLREVQAGEIRVPRFQRPFVWRTDQRLDLFKSIYEGIPIGSFLIWRTRDHDLQCYDRLGPLHMAWPNRKDERDSYPIRQYLLDGHQRLTTLYAALGEGLADLEPVTEAGTDPLPDEPKEVHVDADWPIFFDLEERTFVPHPRREKLPVTWLPLSILLDPSKLYDFQKKLLEAGCDRALVNRAESLASTFKDYSIPVVPIATEDLELATQSFQRVNSGTKMTEVHMVSALAWTPDFDLNERMKEILTELGEIGWQALEEKMILNVCKAALNLDIYYADTEAIGKAIKNRPQILQEATESLKVAGRFLREHCKVYGPAVLPYSFQVVLLADAIQRVSRGPEKSLRAGAVEALKKWFWLTTYTEHFAGISAVRLDRTLKHLRRVAAETEDPNPPGMFREVTSAPRRFDFRAARSRAIALRLAELRPQSNSQESYDPFQLLADLGPDAMPMLIPSREVKGREAEGPENRFLVPPKEASFLRRFFRDPLLEVDPKLLASHAISKSAAEALKTGALTDFLRLRREELNALERTFVENLGLELIGD